MKVVSTMLIFKYLHFISCFSGCWSDCFVLCCYVVPAKVKEQRLPIKSDEGYCESTTEHLSNPLLYYSVIMILAFGTSTCFRGKREQH